MWISPHLFSVTVELRKLDGVNDHERLILFDGAWLKGFVVL